MNGLKRRLAYPEFIELINSYDIFCTLETNMGHHDIVDVKGYIFHGKTRNVLTSKKSGGIGIYVKEELSQHVEILNNACEYILWLKLNHTAVNVDSDILIGVIYLPPTGSRYLDEDQMLLLDDEITRNCVNYTFSILLGDVNARTACLADYIVFDDFLSSHVDFDSDTTNYFQKHVLLENLGYPLLRHSKDKKTNPHGYFLIEICRNINLFILNGRVGSDKGIGEFTFRNKSVIDYALASADLLRYVSDFKITETDSLFSDGHAIISVDLSCIPSKQNKQNNSKTQKHARKWNSKLSDKFVNNINTEQLLNLLQLPDSKDTINSITSEIASVFENAAQKTFTSTFCPKAAGDKPWFGSECRRTRKSYHKAKKKYHHYKTNYNKSKLSRVSKQYKNTMHKYINIHRHKTEQKLRNMNKQNPKQYWAFINSLKAKSNTDMPPIDELYKFFKGNNAADDRNEHFDLPQNYLLNSEEELNCSITENEILKHICNLKNSKAPSPSDSILNEYIKTSRNIMLPIYTNLFNRVLDTGIMPECWLEGYIIPIHKKGDPMDPSNYRPITLLSCLGKLFTSILNTRVTNFVEEHDILNENQAGFRKNYSTTDHIFALHSLIELLKKSKKKLYCAFVDFAAAFDSVWRIGVWQKLLSSSINGKVFRLIHNMYEDIKSCIFIDNQTSDFFACQRGVRQGENLSPILFSIFLNDLESNLIMSGSRGIDIQYGDVHQWLKLLILLYADDTLIVSDNPTDFQNSLDYFSNYCQTWKLKVNLTKSNVIVFGARNTGRYNFKLVGEIINIINKYKYLGIYFTSNGSFATARKHLTEQANKAMYMLYSRIYNLDLPIDLQIKLFDHTIVPIITYNCEVWGFESLNIIEKVHNNFLRKITRTRKSTPIYMLHGELGRYPLSIIVKSRLIGYWNRLVTGTNTKYAYLIYMSMICNPIAEYKWPTCIRNILTEVGRFDLWLNQLNLNSKSIKFIVKRTLIDQYLQTWNASMNNSNKGRIYNSFKTSLCFEDYLIKLPQNAALTLLRLRTANHRFPIETGRWSGTEMEDRICNICNLNEIGSEQHYILRCTFFHSKRETFIQARHLTTPTDFAFRSIMTSDDRKELLQLSKFAAEIINKFR
ncbi:MAG: reverse transcriptase family protein [Sedimenticola sp.]